MGRSTRREGGTPAGRAGHATTGLPGGVAEIEQKEDPRGGRQAGLAPLPVDGGTELVDGLVLAAADFLERLPHFRLKAHT
ncbi:MAG: hypothetical protein ABT940_14860, partial [Alphaproteobacteria bacterium]